MSPPSPQEALGRLVEPFSSRLSARLGGRARRRVIVLLSLVLALNAADQAAIGAVGPQLESALGVSTVQLGLLVTVSSLVGAAATIPMGNLVDRVRRVPLLAWVILSWGLAEAVSALSVNFAMLVGTRVLLGAVTALAAPAAASLTGDLFPPRDRGRVYGVLITGELIGAGFGVLASGLVAGWFGWRPAMALLAVPSVALWWALRRALPEPARDGSSQLEVGAEFVPGTREDPSREGTRPKETGWSSAPDAVDEDDAVPAPSAVAAAALDQGARPTEDIVVSEDPTGWTLRQAVRYVLKVRTNVVMIVASSLGYFFFAGLKTYAVVFARGHYGVSQGVATLLVIAVGVGAIAGAVSGGRIADRLIARGRVTARLEVAVVGFVVAAAILVPGVITGSLLFAVPLLVLAGGAIAAPNATLDAARLDVVPSQLWGRAEAVRTMLRTLLEAFAPLVFGLVAAQFGSTSQGFQATSGGSSGSGGSAASRVTAAQAGGLEATFLIMLVPLALSGLLLLAARRAYPSDVASAAESQRVALEASRGRGGEEAEATAA